MSKIKYWDKLQYQIERGKQGLNTGIPFEGFTTLSDYVKNIQQGRYDLVFAGTGVGKTAFINSTYVYGGINFLQNNPDYIHNLEIIYYSLEIPPEHQIAKHIASLIWKEHGILTSKDEILSIGNTEIRPEVDRLINSYQEKMDEIQSKFLFYRSSLNYKFLWKDILSYAEKRGKIIKNEEGLIVEYIPNNPGLITLIVIDHIGLVDYSSFKDLKEAIDQISRSLVFFRNMFNFSPLVVVQSNRGSEGMDRREDNNWMPMISDIKNTNNLAEDANTIMGIASPLSYKVEKCLGYDITKYKDRYRLVKLLKNRDGSANKLVSFLFIGEYGGYYQLPTEAEDSSPPEELKKINAYYKSLKTE